MDNLIKRHNEIVFHNQGHRYELNGDSDMKFTSVTTRIHEFTEPFDADKIAGIMSKGDLVKEAQIRYEWANSSTWGNYIHRLLELYTLNKFQGLIFKSLEEIPKQYLEGVRILQDLKKESWTPVFPELIVWDKDLAVCGSVDLILQNQNNELMILDYKTSNKISFCAFQGKRMKSPLNQIDDCKGLTYSLQLNLYKYIILRHTDLKVARLCILHVPKGKKGELIDIDDMQSDIELMFANT